MTRSSLYSPGLKKAGKGAYSAIVFKEGSMYVAEDNVGTVIKEDTDAATVINAALSGGGRTVITEGTYPITSTLSIANNYDELVGMGEGTVLEMNTACNIITIDNKGYGRIADLRIDGNSRSYVGNALNFANTCGHIHVQNVHVHDLKGSAVSANWLWDSELLNIVAERCGDPTGGSQKPVFDFKDSGGESNTNAIKMTDCHIEDNYWYGVYVSSLSNSIALRGLKCHGESGTSNYGLYIDGYRIKVIDTYITYQDTWALYSSSLSKHLLIDSAIITSSGNGIYLGGFDNQIVNMNISVDTTGYGVQNNADRNNFSNVIVITGKYGFYHSVGTHCTYTSCTAKELQQHGFYINDARQVFIGCHALNCGQAATDTYDGFFFTTAADRCLISACIGRDWQGTPTQRWGINLPSGVAQCEVIGCMAQGNATGGINVLDGSSYKDHCIEI